MNSKLVTASEIVVLKRGKERIIFNAEEVNPVYFPRGGDEVLELLEGIKALAPFSSLPDNICPEKLFDFFRVHSLIVLENKSRPQKGCIECSLTDGLSHQRSVYLLLSHSCNQACIYCLNGRKTYKKDDRLMMSEKIACEALKSTIKTISGNGKMEVVFFGGEPLLNWPLAKKVIHYCEHELIPKNPGKKVIYHLTTNLTLFPDDLIETAKKYNMTFLVDVDGPEDLHNKTRPFVDGKGTFQKTAENINKLLWAGLKVSLRATVTSYNDERMMEVAQTHRDLGGASCAFVPLNPVDSDGKLLPLSLCPSPQKLARGLREVFRSQIWPVKDLYPFNEFRTRLNPSYKNHWGCGAPFGNTPVITSSGEIFSCIYLVGNKKYEAGHTDFGDFSRQEVLSAMMDIVNVDYREKCRECGFRYICGGGCPVGVFSIAGHPQARSKLKNYVHKISCTLSKTVLSELFWDLARNIDVCG